MKNIIVTVLLILSVTLAVHSQDAKAIVISDQDAKLAKSVWQEKMDADKAWDNLVERIKQRYVAIHKEHGGCAYTGNVVVSDKTFCGYPAEWSEGIKFTADFKVIVPEHIAMPPKLNYPCGTLVPALSQ
jgi:thioredoxin-related protein